MGMLKQRLQISGKTETLPESLMNVLPATLTNLGGLALKLFSSRKARSKGATCAA